MDLVRQSGRGGMNMRNRGKRSFRGRLGPAFVAAIVAGALLAVGRIEARELRQFSVGSWSMSADGDDRGRLASCTAAATYRSGIMLLFLIRPDETWALALAGAPVKRLRRPGSAVTLALKVDALPPRLLDGRMSDGGLLVARLPDDDDMFEALRQGRKLYVAAADRSWTFDLKDTFQMLTALYRCATSASEAPPTPPIADAPRRDGGRDLPPPAAAAPPPPQAVPAGTIRTGSGFFIQDNGTGLTNAHVVRGCRAAVISGFGPAEIVARDSINDLALVRLRLARTTAQAAIRRAPLQLGESVYVLGFPLAGELDNGLNFTSGLVSSLAGAGNDTRHLQLTAPIQLGNSGGPIVDRSGAVVGVTQSKFNDLVALERNGSLTQNLNFGIKADLAASFLRANGVEPREAEGLAPLEPTEIAKVGRAFTFQILCTVE